MRNGNALLEIFSHVKKLQKQTKYCAEPRKRRKEMKRNISEVIKENTNT